MDPGWIAALVAGLIAVLTAVGNGVVWWLGYRRTVRADEVTVLHQSIAELRGERDACQQELRTLRDELTAAKVAAGRLTERVAYLEGRACVPRAAGDKGEVRGGEDTGS